VDKDVWGGGDWTGGQGLVFCIHGNL
jgi:hypothetical protein